MYVNEYDAVLGGVIRRLSFGYDNDGLLMSAGATTVTRAPATGLLTSSAVGAVATSFAYNGFGELTSHATTIGGTPVYSAVLGRDAGGRIQQQRRSWPVRRRRTSTGLIMTRIAAFVVGLALATGCAPARIDRQAIAGTYRLNAENNFDTLVVVADGTYVHTYRVGTEAVRQGGSWYLEDVGGEAHVTFEKFVSSAGRSMAGTPAFWSVAPEDRGDTIRLTVSDDLGIWYDQVK